MRRTLAFILCAAMLLSSMGIVAIPAAASEASASDIVFDFSQENAFAASASLTFNAIENGISSYSFNGESATPSLTKSGISLNGSDYSKAVITLKNCSTATTLRLDAIIGGSVVSNSVAIETGMRQYKSFTVAMPATEGTITSLALAFPDSNISGEIKFSKIVLTKDVDLPNNIGYEFEESSDINDWAFDGIDSKEISNGSLNLSAETGGSKYIYTPGTVQFQMSKYPVVKVRLANDTTASELYLYFKSDDSNFAEEQKKKFPIDYNPNFKEYSFDFSDVDTWDDSTFKQFMIYYYGSGTLKIDYIRFCLAGDNIIENTDNTIYYDFDDNTTQGFTGTNVSAQNQALILNGAASQSTNFALADYTHTVMKIKNSGNADNIKFYINGDSSKAVSAKLTKNYNGFIEYALPLASIPNDSGTVSQITVESDAQITIDSINIVNGYTPPEAEIDMTISGPDTISEDGGSITLNANIVSNVILDNYGVKWTSDTAKVIITDNKDGTCTVTARANCTAVITASTKDGSATTTKQIVVTGQPEREPKYDLKVMLFGNSIMSHSPLANSDWTGNWGMAASSKDKDYIHRLMDHYVFNKYGKVNWTTRSIVAFEGSVTKDVNADYSSVLNSIRPAVASYMPDIVNLQMGENVNSNPTADEYENALNQLFDMLISVNPNMKINICTSFWGGTDKINGVMQAVEGRDYCTVSGLHVMAGHREYTAAGLFTHTGVAAHPGDLGMETIAQLVWENFDTIINDSFEPDYIYLPTQITINSTSDTINTPYGNLQMSADILPANAEKTGKWSVDNVDLATIDPDTGLLTANNNGTVNVIFTPDFGTKTATKAITISGQTTPFTVTYDANTNEAVTNLPAPNVYAKNNFVLSTQKPLRETYQFAGWTLKDSDEVITTLNITGDVTVYAKWVLAKSWEFEDDGDAQGFTAENGFNVAVREGMLSSLATYTEGTNVLTFASPVLNLDTANHKKLIIGMNNTVFNDNTTVTLTVNTTNGNKTYTKPVTSTKQTQYAFDISDCTGTITGFNFKPANVDCTVNVDYVRIVCGSKVSFNANTTDEVSNLPQDIYPIEANTTVDISSLKPTREYYNFVGWATTPYATKDDVVTSIVADNNITLYAIWDQATAWYFDNDLEGWYSGLSTLTLSASNGALHGVTTAYPYFYSPDVSFSTDKYQKIRVKMAYELDNPDVESFDFAFYFSTAANPTMSEQTVARTRLSGNTTNGQYITIDIDLANVPNWAGSVCTKVRLDPTGSNTCTFSIDSVEFLSTLVASFDVGKYASGNVASLSAEKNQVITLPTPVGVTAYGYTFDCWSDGYNTYKPGDQYTIRDTVNFTAVWKENLNTPIVGKAYEFNTDGDFEGITLSMISSYEVKDGALTTKNVANAYDGRYTFQNIDFDSSYNLMKIRYKANVNSSALLRWQRATDSDGSNGAVSAHEGGRYAGFSYTGNGTWNELVADLSDIEQWSGTINDIFLDPINTSGAEISVDYIRFYRKGDSIVNFDANTTDTVTDMPKTDTRAHKGTGYIVSGVNPQRAGYTFAGWSEQPDGAVLDRIDITKDTTTLYAIWLENKDNVTVTFENTINAQGTVSPVTASANTSVVLPQNAFAKENYTFVGWFDGTTTYQPGDTMKVASIDITLYALWNYKVTPVITPASGSQNVVVKDMIITANYGVDLAPEAIKPEYFSTHYASAVLYNADTKDITIYPNYENITYGQTLEYSFAELPTSNPHVSILPCTYSITTEQTPQYNGENMIPNGSFELPYAPIVTISNSECSVSSEYGSANIGNSSLYVKSKGPYTQAIFRVNIEAEKKYYLSYDAKLLTAQNGTSVSSSLCPAMYSTLGYELATNCGANLTTGGDWKHVEGLLSFRDTTAILADNDKFIIYSNPSSSNGVSFVLDNVDLREAYPVTFTSSDEAAQGAVATQYWPKDKAYILPECTITLGDKEFLGWSDGTNTYQPGDTYIGVAGGTNFTAVFEPDLTLIGKLGDANKDGVITSNDATVILQALVSLISLDQQAEILADTNCDGNVTPYDATQILRYLVELSTEKELETDVYK